VIVLCSISVSREKSQSRTIWNWTKKESEEAEGWAKEMK
jgi:hypothetical protein